MKIFAKLAVLGFVLMALVKPVVTFALLIVLIVVGFILVRQGIRGFIRTYQRRESR